ncbi:hypothetical protein [Pandoraea oxalativorans]|uniref:Uncharacterized protein n=1 Tax=Pandoraea oxalativorans TaxID=573737 RepID=A0A0G3ICG9_9BURK|nr:hypothetical protein [Pandoraea oxalativorans]AKK24897.1 hypothetical protein MB84_29485 [Pandoraea oxalativorans]
MKAKLSLLLALVFTTFGVRAAGDFTLTYFGDGKPVDMSALVSDLITPEYVKRFPAKRYEIVLIYHCTPVTARGDIVCTATSGLSPKIDAAGRTGTLVPPVLFNTAAIQPKGASARDVDETRNKVIRQSVSALMSDLPAAPKRSGAIGGAR